MEKRISDFFALYTRLELEKGVLLVRENQTLDSVYYIKSGAVGMFDISKSGNKIVLNIFTEGAFVPMSLAINKTPSNFFYETTATAILYKAPVDEVVIFIKSNPDVMFDLLSRVYSGTDKLLKRLSYKMGNSARAQVVNEICQSSLREGVATSSDTQDAYTVDVNESGLASRTGLSRETVNREIQKLKKEKLVLITKGSLVVISLSALLQLID
jgi:CRP-like cAMP-binding protein